MAVERVKISGWLYPKEIDAAILAVSPEYADLARSYNDMVSVMFHVHIIPVKNRSRWVPVVEDNVGNIIDASRKNKDIGSGALSRCLLTSGIGFRLALAKTHCAEGGDPGLREGALRLSNELVDFERGQNKQGVSLVSESQMTAEDLLELVLLQNE